MASLLRLTPQQPGAVTWLLKPHSNPQVESNHLFYETASTQLWKEPEHFFR